MTNGRGGAGGSAGERVVAGICKQMIEEENRGAAARPYFEKLFADSLCFRRASRPIVDDLSVRFRRRPAGLDRCRRTPVPAPRSERRQHPRQRASTRRVRRDCDHQPYRTGGRNAFS